MINRSLLVTPLTFIYLLPTCSPAYLTFSSIGYIACHAIVSLALSRVNTCSSPPDRARPTIIIIIIIIDHSETRSPLQEFAKKDCNYTITMFRYNVQRFKEDYSKLQIVSRTANFLKEKERKVGRGGGKDETRTGGKISISVELSISRFETSDKIKIKKYRDTLRR